MSERTEQAPRHSARANDTLDRTASTDVDVAHHEVWQESGRLDAPRPAKTEIPPNDIATDDGDVATAELSPISSGDAYVTYFDDEPEPPRSRERGQWSTRRERLGARMGPSTGVWIGLALVAVGFAAIFYTWGKVAGLLNVAQQVPFLVSGGLSGLALVIVGVTVVDVAIRREDSHERRDQLALITRTLDELHKLLDREEPSLADAEEWEEGA